jgi:hypothetical protein
MCIPHDDCMTQEKCDAEEPGTVLVGCECLDVDPCAEQTCNEGERWSFEECQCVRSIFLPFYLFFHYFTDRLTSKLFASLVLMRISFKVQTAFVNVKFLKNHVLNNLDFSIQMNACATLIWAAITSCNVLWVINGIAAMTSVFPIVCENSASCEGNYAFDKNCVCQCGMAQERCDEEETFNSVCEYKNLSEIKNENSVNSENIWAYFQRNTIVQTVEFGIA